MEYKIVETAQFREEFKKRVPREIRREFLPQMNRLRTSPYGIGKPLGCCWLRELRARNYRAYYFIADAQTIVLLAGASDKKTQQETIMQIKREHKTFLDKIYKPREVL